MTPGFFTGRSAEARQAAGPAPRAFANHTDQPVTRELQKAKQQPFR